MIVAINRVTNKAMTADKKIYPITNWFDADGEECEPVDALTACAGAGDQWFTIVLAEFGMTKQ